MWRAIFEGIGDFFQWTFGILEMLGSGFNGIGFVNVFWIFVIAALNIYWISQMRGHAKKGEH